MKRITICILPNKLLRVINRIESTWLIKKCDLGVTTFQNYSPAIPEVTASTADVGCQPSTINLLASPQLPVSSAADRNSCRMNEQWPHELAPGIDELDLLDLKSIPIVILHNLTIVIYKLVMIIWHNMTIGHTYWILSMSSHCSTGAHPIHRIGMREKKGPIPGLFYGFWWKNSMEQYAQIRL